MADQDAAREWRALQEFPHHEVASDGIVRRTCATAAGAPGHPRPALYVLKPYLRPRTGHLRVSLRDASGKSRSRWVHRLVIEAFVGPRPSPMHQVAHSNGNPADNRVCNLRWATAAENAADRDMHGRTIRGETHHQRKITEDIVRDIRSARAVGEPGVKTARRLGVSASLVSMIGKRQIWRHI